LEDLERREMLAHGVRSVAPFSALTHHITPPLSPQGAAGDRLVGLSGALWPSKALFKRGLAESPIGAAVAAGLSLTSLVGGLDFVIPVSFDRIWIYHYAGASFTSSFSSIAEGSVGSFSVSVGLVGDVKKPEDYAGSFLSLTGSLAGKYPRLVKWIPTGGTMFTSPDQNGSYGISTELYASGAQAPSNSQSASWT
jgi:hypothetical protein